MNRSDFQIRRAGRVAVLATSVLVIASVLSAEEYKTPQPEPIRHQVTGLFSPDRVEDLRQVFAQLPEFKLVDVDYAKAEIRLAYDPAQVFPNATPEQVVERLDNLLRQSSRHTFGAKPLTSMPQEKLTLLEIPVVGLDCKGCCLGAYEAIYRIEGVERATASFKDGLVTAWIDPQKTNRAALEEALQRRNVQLATP